MCLCVTVLLSMTESEWVTRETEKDKYVKRELRRDREGWRSGSWGLREQNVFRLDLNIRLREAAKFM